MARFEAATGVPVVPLLTVAELEAALAEGLGWPADAPRPGPEVLEALRAYRRRYGVGAAP